MANSQHQQERSSSGIGRIRDLVRRGIGHAGPDRDTLLLILKSALAATVAWILASIVLGAPSATFAPFSALLMVQATVSRSMDQALRYALAVVAGVVLAGLLAPLLGTTVWTFALLMVVALILGRWRRLGSQGPQVAVAALFAYSSFTQAGGLESSMAQLGSIAGLVVLGCAIGVITNLAILPPIRYRAADYAISGLARSVSDLLTDLADTVEHGVPASEDADSWQDRAQQLRGTVSQTWASIEHAEETLRFNPRRFLMRTSPSFSGYHTIANTLERVTEQLQSITRGLRYAAETDNPGPQHDRFLSHYSDLLDRAADCSRTLGELHSVSDIEDSELAGTVRRARSAFEDLHSEASSGQLDSTDGWPTYGALETDAHRLVEEFREAERTLADMTD